MQEEVQTEMGKLVEVRVEQRTRVRVWYPNPNSYWNGPLDACHRLKTLVVIVRATADAMFRPSWTSRFPEFCP